MSRFLLAFFFVLGISMPSFAGSIEGRASVGGDVSVPEGETVDHIACAFCSVHVHGRVTGNVAVFMGSISVDEGQRIDGNVAGVGGDLRLGEGATVGGNVAIMAGDTRLAPGASIHGQQATMPGKFWLLLFLLPLLIPAAIIWLIVYIVQRNRYRFPAYPGGRGF